MRGKRAPTLSRRVRFTSVAAGLAIFVLVALPGTAQPAFPGTNGKIAYTGYDASAGFYEIYVVDADGSGRTELTTNSVNNNPAWSPDGTKIAFTTFRNNNDDIYLMNADGSGQTRLTASDALDGEAAWSPDGSKIAFISDQNGDGVHIYVMNADGSGRTQLTTGGSTDQLPAWSPDGTKIAFDSNRGGAYEIYVMAPDGSGLTRLTTDGADDERPTWSPDGSKIAFESNRDGDPHIYVMNADGSGETRLTSSVYDIEPAWSPDGKKIVFVSARDGFRNLYAVNADGSGPVDRLTAGDDHLLPDWQPIPSADLAVGLAASSSSVKGSQRLTYAVDVRNAGPSPASGVVVTDTLPSQTTFVSAAPSRGSCLTPPPGSTGAITCNLGTLAASQKAVTQVVVTVLARKASITDTASVASNTADPSTVNNTATITTVVK